MFIYCWPWCMSVEKTKWKEETLFKANRETFLQTEFRELMDVSTTDEAFNSNKA